MAMKMNKSITVIVLVVIAATIITACHKKKDASSAAEPQNVIRSNDELRVSQDSTVVGDSVDRYEEHITALNALDAEVDQTMQEINNIDKKLDITDFSKQHPVRRAKLRNDIMLIKNQIQERQQKLSKLEEKIKNAIDLDESSKIDAEETVARLKRQLKDQKNKVNKMSSKLLTPKKVVKEVKEVKDSVQVVDAQPSVETVTDQEEDIAEQNEILSNEFNECFYCIGTESELKNSKVTGSGFMKKTKVMQSSNVMHTYFIKADKRTLNEIPLNCRKAKVLTTHDASSYSIEEVNEMLVIKILDPALFWEYSNYLVVQTEE